MTKYFSDVSVVYILLLFGMTVGKFESRVICCLVLLVIYLVEF
jgi:hypothetical protein